MKMRKNKGKVHPFTSSSSSSSSSSSQTPNKDALSVLKLLPAAILALISVLSLEDTEVLAYMITRSLKSTNPSFFHSHDKKTNTKNKEGCFDGKSPALFDCECFHCYTSFWFRWDSSPNRELIHQAIEAFDDHLNNGELLGNKGTGNGKSKRKEKMGRRKSERTSGGDGGDGGVFLQFPAVVSPGCQETHGAVLPEREVVEEESGGAGVAADGLETAAAPVVVVRNHKGLARKVLPDVIGIFSSRLWSLWSPNV